MTNQELGDLHKKLGIPVTRMAKKLGIDPSSFHRYLSGKSPIPKNIELAMRTIERDINEAKGLEISDKITLLINSPKLESEHLKEFGIQLKELREKRSMSQSDFSNLTSRSMSFISDVENGKRNNLTIRSIQKFAKALKIKIEIMFEYQKTNG
jgi:transcriptional regulator with XRE-family HTH domain